MRKVFILFLIFLSAGANLLLADSTPALSYDELANNYLAQKNRWIVTHKNHKEYNDLKEKIEALKSKMAHSKKYTREDDERLELLLSKQKLYETLPRNFVEIINDISIDIEAIKINLISYIAKAPFNELSKLELKLSLLKKEYSEAIKYLNDYRKKTEYALSLSKTPEKEKIAALLKEIDKDIHFFNLAFSLFDKKTENLEMKKTLLLKKINNYENTELLRVLLGIPIIIGFFLILWLSRIVINKYVHIEEKQFLYNRLVWLTALILLLVILLIIYIENILYALTFLGIIGAALTISLKEIWLNFAAWAHMIFTNSIKVGDRILISNENMNMNIVGDVINISLNRITLYESINYTASHTMKASGRIIFIPNSFVFSKPVFNYSHEAMTSIFDLIEFDFSYDSNLPKIIEIVEKITERFAGKYVNDTARQYMQLKKRYNMRHRTFEPVIRFVPSENRNFLNIQGTLLFL